jgi:hypothetical protein
MMELIFGILGIFFLSLPFIPTALAWGEFLRHLQPSALWRRKIFWAVLVASVFNHFVFWFDVLFIPHMSSMAAVLETSSFIGKVGEALSIALVILAPTVGTGAAPLYIAIASVGTLGLWAAAGLL